MEFEYYAVIGGIMMTCFVVGGAMVANTYSPPEIRAAGSLMISGGWVLLLVMVGFGSYEIWKRVRDWNIERRSEVIDRKLDQLHIKERERELKRREREIREEQERKEQEYRKRKYVNSSDVSSHQPFQHTKQQESETKKSEPIHPPVQNLQKSVEQRSEEEPVLRTGGLVPDNLIKKESIEEEVSGLPEKIQSIEDYIVAVQQSPEMLCLWSLFRNPKHSYENLGHATRSIYKIRLGKRSGSREQDVSKAMKELENYALVEITTKTEYQEPKKKKRKIGEFDITDFGMEFMKRAEEDRISTWHDFLEKYKPEPKNKK